MAIWTMNKKLVHNDDLRLLVNGSGQSDISIPGWHVIETTITPHDGQHSILSFLTDRGVPTRTLEAFTQKKRHDFLYEATTDHDTILDRHENEMPYDEDPQLFTYRYYDGQGNEISEEEYEKTAGSEANSGYHGWF